MRGCDVVNVDTHTQSSKWLSGNALQSYFSDEEGYFFFQPGFYLAPNLLIFFSNSLKGVGKYDTLKLKVEIVLEAE